MLRFASVAQEGISLFLDFPQAAGAMHWVNLTDGVARYQQEFTFFYPERRATLIFPSPFLRGAPVELVLEGGSQEGPRPWRPVGTISFEVGVQRELPWLSARVTQDPEPRPTA